MSTNTKHTPGPWTVKWENPWTEDEGGEMSINAFEWEQLAKVYASEGMLPTVGAANARLIAASPDLLEVLKETRDMIWKQGLNPAPTTKAGHELAMLYAKEQGLLLDRIEAAIVKATGNNI